MTGGSLVSNEASCGFSNLSICWFSTLLPRGFWFDIPPVVIHVYLLLRLLAAALGWLFLHLVLWVFL